MDTTVHEFHTAEEITEMAVDGILQQLKKVATQLDEDDLNAITRIVKLAVLDTQLCMIKSEIGILSDAFKETLEEFEYEKSE